MEKAVVLAEIHQRASRLNLVHRMIGGEKRGYIIPGGDFIDVAGFKSHDYLAKILGFESCAALIEVGLVRVAHSDYDMVYEVAPWNQVGLSNIEASLRWNIGTKMWPANASVIIEIGGNNIKFTVPEYDSGAISLKSLSSLLSSS